MGNECPEIAMGQPEVQISKGTTWSIMQYTYTMRKLRGL